MHTGISIGIPVSAQVLTPRVPSAPEAIAYVGSGTIAFVGGGEIAYVE